MKRGFVDTGKMKMAYFSFGKGERAMVILPGLDCKSALEFAPAVENAYRMFKDDFTVYVFDRREDMPDPYPIRQMAQDTAEAMRALSLKNACVFGASMGGMIAQYLASDHPETVEKMLLGSTIYKANPTAEAVIEQWISLAGKGDRRGLSQAFVDVLYSEEFAKKYGRVLLTLNDRVSDEDLRRFIICARAIESFDASQALSQITCPVMAVGSKGDRVTGDQATEELASCLSCACYMYDESTAHCVFDEAPDYKERMYRFFMNES